jgi:hypothetical protein
MTSTTLSYYRVQKNLQAKIGSISFPEINWKIVCILGFIACLPLLVFYVWQINGLTRGSYLIGSYEKQISKLSEENRNLQVSFAENSFLGQALAKMQALNFKKVTSVKYIQILDNSVATAQKDNMR